MNFLDLPPDVARRGVEMMNKDHPWMGRFVDMWWTIAQFSLIAMPVLFVLALVLGHYHL